MSALRPGGSRQDKPCHEAVRPGHYLNPVPIRMIHDRWRHKYAEREVSAVLDLQARIEDQAEGRAAWRRARAP